MSTTVDLTGEMIDVRDIIARVEELEKDRDYSEDEQTWAEENASDADELSALMSILEDLKGYGGDEQWRGDWYPVTLIHEDHFEDYAQELAEDIGAVNRDAQWPNNHIDWKAAAEDLLQDYSEVDVDGTTYYYR
ncbi:MAG TPA: hypothetical protein PKJ19_08145 [Flavobacteriales bacterium]|nr:hypothetical protein [Flavobacteriales bacterium]